jgi:hypothetical protein
MTKIERYAIFMVVTIASVAIVECAYLGITGLHSFRQSDAYGYLLGILHIKDFRIFDLFAARPEINTKAVFDIPIYESLAAIISKALDKDPLVSVRYLNYGLWLVVVYFGYKLSEQLSPSYSGFIYLILLCSSPLFLHYFSVPLPDNLALACSLLASYLVLTSGGLVNLIGAFLLITVAAAVKSPIPFVFLVYCGSMLSLRQISIDAGDVIYEKPKDRFLLMGFFVVCALVTVVIEFYRQNLMSEYGPKSGHHWQWYFGELDMRFMSNFWQTVIARFNEWIPPYFSSIFIGGCLASMIADRRKTLSLVIPFLISFMSGWLVFANLYRIHNYYQLPVALISFVSFACILSISIRHYSMSFVERTGLSSGRVGGAIIASLCLFFIYESIAVKSYTNKTRVDFWKAAEFALHDANKFLLVSNKLISDPQFGGRVSTKFVAVGAAEYENNCQKYSSEYYYVIVAGYRSKCVEDNKIMARYYISDNGLTLFGRRP